MYVLWEEKRQINYQFIPTDLFRCPLIRGLGSVGMNWQFICLFPPTIYIYIFIYPCISNKFQRSYEIYFSHANFCRIQIYLVLFRLSLYIYCLVTRIYGTKVADEKYVECWSTKCNPLHKFSFDINVTFFPGVQLIKRTETIAAERKGRIMSIQKYL